MQLHVPRQWHALGLRAEVYLKELLGVKRSMPVCRSCNWGGDSCPCGVDSLPNVASVDTAGDFFDQDWGEALGSKVLVHTKEVDLGALNLLSVKNH